MRPRRVCTDEDACSALLNTAWRFDALIRCLALAAVHACLNEEYDEEVVDEAVTELDEG